MESKIKKQAYLSSPHEISIQRLSKVQDVLGNDSYKADCLLIITGIDSRFNIGSKNALEKILPGITSYSIAPSSDVTSDDAIDDLVICIKKASVHIYCNPKNYDLIMKYAAAWNNTTVYCLDESQYENNEDQSEDLKLKSFVEMLNGCQCIAIPYNYGIAKEYQVAPFDAMLIEKWPLIQAFALEEIGGGVFFTLKHEVIDGTELMNDSFSNLDQLSLELLITKNLPQFEKQWTSLIDNVGMFCESDGDLDSFKVVEPLLTYFHHAPIEFTNMDKREPYVLFGVHTNEQTSGKADKKKMLLKETGIEGSRAYHMVCNGKDSKGMISCTRTYFFQTAKGILTGEQNMKTEEELESKETTLLANCYLLAVEAFDVIVDDFKKPFESSKCKDAIISYIIQESRKKKLHFLPSDSNINVECHSMNLHGSECSSSTGSFHNISITISNIPSLKHPGASLGSVAFSDTFLTSTIHFAEGAQNIENLVMTQNVKRFISWPAVVSSPKLPSMHSPSGDNTYESMLGKTLIESSSAVLIYGKWPMVYTDEVVFYGFEKALILQHGQSGFISLPISHIDHWQIFDNDSMASITMLFIKPNESLLKCFPFWLSNRDLLMLAFLPRSKAHSAFYENAYHVWKENEDNPLKSNTDLSLDQKMIYNRVEDILKASEEKELPLAHQFKKFRNLKKFFKHLHISSNISEPLKEKEMHVILNESLHDDAIAADDSEIMLTILTGLPGSGSESLSKSLVSLAREASRWLAIKVPNDIRVPFSAQAFQEQLSLTYRTITQQKGRPQASSRKRRRLIIQTQGFVDIRDVIDAIEEHPDELLRSRLKIGSVTCCINPSSLYLCGKMHIPFILEQCCSGYVNQAVFTSCLEPDKTSLLANCKKLIRYCNPGISFLIAKGGEVTRTPDVELILSDHTFQDHNAFRARKLLNKHRLPEEFFSQITIPFEKPIDKANFAASLKQMKGKMESDGRLKGVVLYMEGKVAFLDHSDVHHFKWSKLLGMTSLNVASNQISPRPPSSKDVNSFEDQKTSKYFVTFFGIRIESEQLRVWMKQWSQAKKQLLSRDDISKEKLDEIAKCHKFDALPPGWFYNGTQFVSFGGDKQNQHPLFDDFVDDYVAKMNKDIKSYNNTVDNKDLFTQ